MAWCSNWLDWCTGKRSIVVLLALGLSVASAPRAFMTGDLNGDGKVTVADVVMALDLAVRGGTLTADQLAECDVSPMPGAGPNLGKPWGDGKIGANDVTVLLRRLIGLNAAPFPLPDDSTALSALQRDVFTPSCAISSCHGHSIMRAGLDLSAGNSYSSLVNVSTSLVGASLPMRVVPGHPETSFLLTKLTQPGPHDGSVMPFGTMGLDSLTVARIREWVANGAKPDAGDMDGPPARQPGITEDVSLPTPSAGQGFQIVVGPFEVPYGQEIFPTYYRSLPNDQTVDVSRIEYATNQGTHHMYVSQIPGANLPDSVTPTTTTMFAGGEETFGFIQNRYVNQVLPPGVVFRLQPHDQLEIQLHYVNNGTQLTPTGRGKVVINFWTEPPSDSHILAHFFQDSNSDLRLPPHSTTAFTLPYTFVSGAHVFALWGHFHSRGKEFTIQRYSGGVPGETVYQSATWDDPQYQPYDPVIDIAPGDGLFATAVYENDGESTIVTGPYVTTNEHMFMMGLYYEK